MKRWTLGLAAAALVGFIAAPASAGSLSSSKVAFTFGDLVGLGAEACSEAGILVGNCVGGGAGGAGVDDTDFVTVMQTFIKTPNGKELSIDAALQCALVTYTKSVAKGGGSGSGKSNAKGRILVRVAVDEVDNNGLPTGAPTRYALPDNDTSNVLGFSGLDPSTGPDGVTYCFRFQELEVSFENLQCLSDESIDPDEDCIIAVSLLLETLNAHAFNFVLDNVSSGNKKISVQARAVADSNVYDADSSARGEAFVGMGSTRIETLRAVQAFDPADGPIFDFIDLQ